MCAPYITPLSPSVLTPFSVCVGAVCPCVFVVQMPKLTFKSNAKPSLYAYPPPLEEEKKKEREKVKYNTIIIIFLIYGGPQNAINIQSMKIVP